MPVFLAIALPLLSLLCLWRSHASNRHRRLIGNLPTSKTQGVFIGLVELKGTAECEAPVRSFLAEAWCVHYSYSVDEHWERTVTETYTDSEGRTQTRTRTESGWTTVARGGESVPFYLQDDTGIVLVRPHGAEIRPKSLFRYHCGPGDPLYYGKGPAGSVSNSTHRRSFTESGIPLHQLLFVVGQAREREDVVAPELAHDAQAPLYLLTVENEEQVMSRLGFKMHFLNVLGLALAGGAGVAMEPQPGWPGALLGAGIYLVAWFVTWVVMVYNALVDVRNRMKQGWSQVEVQLKRRHDLLGPLIEVVQGLSTHESEVQKILADLRGQAQGNGGTARFHGVARQIMGLAERYPQIKAAEGFAQLQAALIETEQRIALARGYFNDVATAYNTRLEVVPDGWFGRLAGFVRQPLLHAEDFERARVEVNLAR